MSGAGRQFNQKQSNLFVDIESNLRAYGVGTHRHTPEIEQALSIVAGKPIVLTFVPHLAPLDRGILATIFARPKAGVTTATALSALRDFYTRERAPVVRVVGHGGQKRGNQQRRAQQLLRHFRAGD